MSRAVIWGIACTIILSTCSAHVTAATGTVEIAGRGVTQATVGYQRLVLEQGDYVIWNWTSTGSLDFQLFDPDGLELMNQEQSVGTNGIISISTTGTYSWRYSNWNTATVIVTFYWGRIDKANVIDERLNILEAAFLSLNQSISLMKVYLDDLESGSVKYPWLDENLTRIHTDIQEILVRLNGMPVNNDIEELDSDISELNAQIIHLQENLTKVQNDNTKYHTDQTIFLSVFILLVAIVLVIAIVRGRGRRK